jgi:hypothetical protein
LNPRYWSRSSSDGSMGQRHGNSWIEHLPLLAFGAQNFTGAA